MKGAAGSFSSAQATACVGSRTKAVGRTGARASRFEDGLPRKVRKLASHPRDVDVTAGK